MDRDELSDHSIGILGTRTDIPKRRVARHNGETESRNTVQKDTEDERGADQTGIDNF